jgi:hypothetical protein
LTLYPSDVEQPTVANSNYNPNEILNNVFTVGLGAADGAFNIFVTSTTHVVVDVTGYYAPPGAGGLYFHPLPNPVRLLETRNDPASPGCYKTNAPLQGGVVRTQPARGVCDGLTIASNALGIVGNATVVNANGGFLTFWPSDATRPLVATSNFSTGQIFNRHFTVGLSAGAGAFNIFALLTTDLVIDVSGYFAP